MFRPIMLIPSFLLSRHGRGVWKSIEEGGDVYEGDYKNDKKCGWGEYTWTNSNVFRGNFENDLR